MRIMKYLLVVFVTLMLAACSVAPATQSKPQAASPTAVNTTAPQKTSTDPVVKFLLTSAAGDFHDHGPKGPLRFRNVRVGHVTNDGKESYRMCGEFLREGDKAEWTPFSTIKTSGYEQYLGGGAATYCPASILWDTQDDLSASLQSQLDSLGPGKQPNSKNNANK